MTHIIRLSDLKDYTLENGDRVLFAGQSVNGTSFVEEYKVRRCYLEGDSSNEIVFVMLGLDKADFLSEHYGYAARGGQWPECKDEDYEALTRVVKAIFQILERPTTIKDYLEAKK